MEQKRTIMSYMPVSRDGIYSFAHKSMSSRPIIFAILVGSLIIGVGIAIGLAIGLGDDGEENVEIKIHQPKSSTGTYKYAAVVADSEICSNIGIDILARYRGNAIDAAVASLHCTGVMNAHSAGAGGGSFFTIYHKPSNTFYNVDSRETAPGKASQNMYVGEENKMKSVKGGMAVGVPGEIRGLWEVHQKLGVLPWSLLVQPTIKLCDEGVPLGAPVFKALIRIENKTEFAPYFDDNGNRKPVGSLIKLPELAQTLRTVAGDALSFYKGPLAQEIVKDIEEAGGIITLEDLANYTVKWSAPTNITIHGGYQVLSTPPPGSGVVLSYILGILSGYNMAEKNFESLSEETLTSHRAVEAFKFAYGKRTELGDEDFVNLDEHIKNMTSPEFGEQTRLEISDAKTRPIEFYHPTFDMPQDQGTTHLSVIDAEGSAVSVTSTINHYFGSKVRGSRTGIVFNNEMDDFSTPNTTNSFGLPASPANFIKPGKRPMSSMCPAIVWDPHTQQVKMITGAAGGSKITTATALNIIDVLWLGMSLGESLDRPRLHHQLVPNKVQRERNHYNQDILDGLKAKGHEIRNMGGESVVQSLLVKDNGQVVGSADYRKGGKPKGY